MSALDTLRGLVDYNPVAGVFTWKVRRNGRGGGVKPGDIAGTLSDQGYLMVNSGGKHYRAHRLAWAFVSGEWPTHEIDHINGVRTDNRLVNLRLVGRNENAHNIGGPNVNNTSGFLGVIWDKRGNRWRAQITIKGRRIVSYHTTAEAAHAAYLKAKHEHHPTHQRLRNQGE
jgi:HNH endonuclease